MVDLALPGQVGEASGQCDTGNKINSLLVAKQLIPFCMADAVTLFTLYSPP